MAKRLQFSTSLRNTRLNQVEAVIGASPRLQIRSGTMPVNCGAPDTGLLLCEILLPASWLIGSVNGQNVKAGEWVGPGTVGGTATYFRFKTGSNTTHCQGNVAPVDGDAAMELDSTTIVVGQPVTVVSFVLTEGNG